MSQAGPNFIDKSGLYIVVAMYNFDIVALLIFLAYLQTCCGNDK